jgi:hypothetical protein
MRIKLLLLILVCGLLPGCSLLSEVNNSLDYVNEATTYINKVTTFSEQIPAMAEQAVTNPEVRQRLITELETMKSTIISFNVMEAPAFAQEAHKQLVSYNDTFLKEINTFFEKVNTNVIDLNTLADSGIVQTIDKITQSIVLIQQLGN